MTDPCPKIRSHARLGPLVALVAALASTTGLALPAAASAGSGFLTPRELAEFERGLALIGMDREDLAFNRDYINAEGRKPDRWRSPLVEGALARPIEGQAEVRAFIEPLTTGVPDPGRALLALSQVRGIPSRESGTRPQASDLRRLFAGLGAAEDELAALGELPPDAAEAVSVIVSGWIRTQASVAETVYVIDGDLLDLLRSHFDLSRGDEVGEEDEAREAVKLSANSDAFDHGAMASAAARLAADLDWAAGHIAGGSKWVGRVDIPTSKGRLVIAGMGDDLHDLAADLIIDLGGDDHYRMLGETPPARGRVQVILDLAGDDVYDAHGVDGQLGGGLLGLGLLHDAAGDDIYRAGRFSLGSGVFGVGLLHDAAGDDSYQADVVSEGAGAFGVGLLLDAVGSDSYRAAGQAQGFATTRGAGLLDDRGGADAYYAGGKYLDNPSRHGGNSLSLSQGFAIGLRPYVAGGLGFLVDGGGNDLYYSEVYGQGVSYWFSLGLLWDRGGDDTYYALQYAQGSGIHLSVGLLVDDAGGDNYTCRHLGQGSSHDLSVGFQIDHAGNDVYAGLSTLQGGALTNSATFFVDGAGDDVYAASELNTSRGTSNLTREYGGIGLFLDLGGKDAYGRAAEGDRPFADGEVARSGVSGLAIDIEVPVEAVAGLAATPAPAPAAAAAEPPAKLPRDPLERLRLAAIWQNKPALMQSAQASLIADGPGVVPTLLGSLRSERLMQQYGLQAVIQGMTRAAADADKATAARAQESAAKVASALISHLESERGDRAYEGLRWPIAWLADLGVERERERARRAIELHVGDPNLRIRHAVAAALGKLADPAGLEALSRLAADREDSVRAAAAGGLAALGVEGAVAPLAELLRDPLAGPREIARRGLVALAGKGHAAAVATAVRPYLAGRNLKAAWQAAELLGQLMDEASRVALESRAVDADPGLRDAARRALAALDAAH